MRKKAYGKWLAGVLAAAAVFGSAGNAEAAGAGKALPAEETASGEKALQTEGALRAEKALQTEAALSAQMEETAGAEKTPEMVRKQPSAGEELADGTYTPDDFAWSGGSGRVEITCDTVTVTDGQAYATIVFSSSSYAYVEVDGIRYDGTAEAETTSFTIPVKLNQNTEIIGMTTKMSVAHEITYTIYVQLEAPDSTSSAADEPDYELMGLTFQGETVPEYAEYFRIYHYDQGISLLEIEPASRYLLVPQQAELPAGLDQELTVVSLPVEHAYISSEAALREIAEELELTDQIAAVSMTEEDCAVEAVAERMAQGKIFCAGSCEEPDYRALVKAGCDLAVFPSETLVADEVKGEDTAAADLEAAAGYFAALQIPVLTDRSSDEKEALAKREWIKVYGALFGLEDQAASVFETSKAAQK